MKLKMLGGILLVTGTSIGGGMLSLPIITAQMGFFNSSLLFVLCWALMTFTALLTLEVNLCFPKNWNVVSIAKATLGRSGEIIAWTIYLFFLYSLVSAYIAGGRDILHGILTTIGIKIPISSCGIFFICSFSFIIRSGINSVEIFNRVIMILKSLLIFLLILYIGPHVNYKNYFQHDAPYLLPPISIIITSFGFSIIIPSLRTYFNDDVKKLRLAIIIGSLLPLTCYIVWNAIILGTIPLNDKYGLDQLRYDNQPLSSLLEAIVYHTQTKNIALLSRLFVSISILTSFVCVSLALSDYLADGFKMDKKNKSKWLTTFLTFIPPFLFVTFFPKVFILFLSLAGLFCVALQGLMPIIMAWNCRYNKQLSTIYQVRGNKPALLIAIFASIFVIFVTLYEMVILSYN